MISYKEKLNKITTFIFDIDGVITNGSLQIFPNGEFVRNMTTRDGYALKVASKKGYNVFVISGGSSEAMRKRLEFLDVKEIVLGAKNKITSYNKIKTTYKLTDEEVLYMGDDIPDIGLLKTVGLSTCPQDACQEVLEVCDYISHYKGGEGAVRDIIRQTMKLHGKWFACGNEQAN